MPEDLQEFARQAREFLAAEAHRTVASEELEKITGLDRFALARHFRAATGTSPPNSLVVP